MEKLSDSQELLQCELMERRRRLLNLPHPHDVYYLANPDGELQCDDEGNALLVDGNGNILVDDDGKPKRYSDYFR